MRFIYAYLETSDTVQKKDDRLFKKLIADTRKRLAKYKTWEYLPSEEHLNALLKTIDFEVDYKIFKDYIRIRRI